MRTQRILPALVLPLLFGACASGVEPTEPGSDSIVLEDPDPSAPINEICPRSGKPVSPDSLTEYRGFVVGFCNTHCRDDFAGNVAERPDDTGFFDELIAARKP